MFRRRWSGLPDDPEFPADLGKLGYHINATDEIRSTADDRFYFNFFLTKNDRHNDRQRFAFNQAVQDIIHARLASCNLRKVPLPSPTSGDFDTPHTPIFISESLSSKKRIVLVVGEREQDLGVLAHRVIGGPGGVDEGSMVSVVKLLQQEEAPLGIVLANTGETWWWPQGKRALAYRQSLGVGMRSAVMHGTWYDPEANGIPGNSDAEEHVQCVFEKVLADAQFVNKEAVVEVIGLGDGAVVVQKYLDANWDRWAGRIGCMALVAGALGEDEVKSEGFKKFLKQKATTYIISDEPLGTPLANAGGNPHTMTFTSYGCPVLSAGEPYYSERAFVKSKGHVLPWMEEVYREGKSYVNPEREVTFKDDTPPEDVPTWSGTPWPQDDSRRPLSLATNEGEDGKDKVDGKDQENVKLDGGEVEIITKEEWEKRQNEAEDRGEEADESTVLVY